MPEESNYERGDKFVRVISLFDLLHRTHLGRTSQDLADELEVDVRSVQRYIKQMGKAGLDIAKDDQGRYRIGDESQLPAMQFTKAEGAAVLIALRLLQQMRPARHDALIGAVGRLAKAMKIETIPRTWERCSRRPRDARRTARASRSRTCWCSASSTASLAKSNTRRLRATRASV